MRNSFVGLLLLGACTFGVEGDFADTEAGLVSVSTLRLAGTESPVKVSSVTSDGIDLVVAFEADGRSGELRIQDLHAMLHLGGTGTMRTRDRESWSAPETVQVAVVSDEPFSQSDWTLRAMRIDFRRLTSRKAQEAPSDDESSELPEDGESSEIPGDSSEPLEEGEPAGSLEIVLVEEHC